MTLPAPKLDSRSFAQLVEEAKARIPRFTPEWTNFNDSDPGMALVQLHAWMTETILYELNRVPELNYIRFLDLIGIRPAPARPARTALSFTLDKLDRPDDPLTVAIPLATRVSVDDPDIREDISFETDRSLIALNADFGMVVVPQAGTIATDVPRRALVTSYDEKNGGAGWLHFFDPFAAPPASGACLYIGLVLRPKLAKQPGFYVADALPAMPFDLYADLAGGRDEDSDGASQTTLPPHGCAAAGKALPQIEWQLYTGPSEPATWADNEDSGWKALAVTSDTSLGLSKSGHFVLELPKGGSAVDPRRLPAAFWQGFGQLRPPLTYEDLLETLGLMPDPAELEPYWEKMGLAGPVLLSAITACKVSGQAVKTVLAGLAPAMRPDPSRLSVDDWQKIDPAFGPASLPMSGGNFRRLYWLRAKYRTPAGSEAPLPGRMRQFRLNTVAATQGLTRLEDRLGRSNGRPGQVFTLPRSPVLIERLTGAPALSLVVGEETGWTRVDDFHGAGPESRVYLLDPGSGRITFGDGLRGRIPVADTPILAARTRIGGGAAGNVGPGAISKIRGQLRGVKAVRNFRAAHDGTDAENMDAVRLRAPHDLRHRDRAVSSDDFSDLAMMTPGVALHRVVTLPRRAPAANGGQEDRPGAVTLVLLPRSTQPRAWPSEAQFEAVCHWLEPRRLVTTELHLTGPDWIDITGVSLTARVSEGHDLTTVAAAVQDAILGFLDPYGGGSDGRGWPFGEAIHHADLYDRILSVPGLRRVWELKVATAAHPDGNALSDRTPIPEGALPFLTRDRIVLAVSYG